MVWTALTALRGAVRRPRWRLVRTGGRRAAIRWPAGGRVGGWL